MTMIKARDLFAGVGWAVAARNLGIQEDGVEWDDDVRRTREVNGFSTVGRDVREVYGRVGGYEIELGSPPCERFTSAGHGDGYRARDEIVRAVRSMRHPSEIYRVIGEMDHHHEKVSLVLEPFRVLLENTGARAAVWEQVPPVLPIWEAVADRLSAWGWSVDTRNVTATWYGVPQSRRRAILLARRDRQAHIPGDTVERVMRDVFPDRDGWVQRSNNSAGSSRPGLTAAERGRTMRRMDQPSVTMTSKGFKWVLPDGTMRTASVRDMSVIQTFPEWVEFTGGVQSQRLQIGNAVPPLMGEHLIRAVL